MNADEERELLTKVRELHAAVVGRADRPDRGDQRDQPRVVLDHESQIASDRDLDGEHGNPEVRSLPKSWQGEDFRGRRYSETSAPFLLALAGLLAWKSQRNRAEGKDRFADFDAKDAARARGWAARLERVAQHGSGRTGRATIAADDDFGPASTTDGSDIPF